MGRGAVAVLSGLSAVVLSVAVFVVIHAGHLERVLTWGVVKRELAARHMTVSLGAGRLGLSGLELSDVTIAITKARKNAPVTSIHLASLRIDASFVSLVFSGQKRIDGLSVDGLSVEALRFARDADDPEKGPGDDEENDEAASLEVAKNLVGLGKIAGELRSFQLTNVTVTTERRSLTTGKVSRLRVEGLGAQSSFRSGSLSVDLAQAGGPLHVVVSQIGARDTQQNAALQLAGHLQIAPGGVADGELTIDLLSQDFDPRAPGAARLFHGKCHAVTSASSEEIRVEPLSFEAVNKVLAGEITLLHRDTPKGSLVSVPAASMKVQIAPIRELLASSVASRVLALDADPLQITAHALAFGAGAAMGPDAEVLVHGALRELTVRVGEEAVAVKGLEANGRIGFLAGGVPHGKLSLMVAHIAGPDAVQIEGFQGLLEADSPGDTPGQAAPTAPTAPKKTLDPGAELTCHLRAKILRNGAARLADVVLDGSAILRGTVVHTPVLSAHLGTLAADGLELKDVSLRLQGPPATDTSAKASVDVTTKLHVAIASLESAGVRAEQLVTDVSLEGTSTAARPTIVGGVRALVVANGQGKTTSSEVKYSVEADGPADFLAAKAKVPSVRGTLEAFGAKVAFSAAPHGKTAHVKASASVPSLAPFASFIPVAGPTLCAKSLAAAQLSLELDGIAGADRLPAGRLKTSGLAVCGAPIPAKIGDMVLSWDDLRVGRELHARAVLGHVSLGDGDPPRGLSMEVRGTRAGARAAEIFVEVKGDRLPDARLKGSFSFQPKTKALVFSLDAGAEHAEYLPKALRTSGNVTLEKLGFLQVNAEGSAAGFIDRWDDAGLALAPQAFTASRGNMALKISVQDARINGQKAGSGYVQNASIDATLLKEGRAVTLKADATCDGLDGEVAQEGGHVDGARASLSVVSPDGERVDVHAALSMKSAKLRGRQRVDLGAVAANIDAQGSRSEAIAITKVEVSLGGTGTHLAGTGSLDLKPRTASLGSGDVVVVGRESAYLRAVLTQDLAPISQAIPGIVAKGRIRFPVVLAAGDRSLVRIDGLVEFLDVHLDWLGGGIQGLEGRVPVTEDIRFEGDSIRLLTSRPDAFSRERFEDQQPFVAETAFIRIKRMTMGEHELGPLGASVRVDRNTLSVDRLELRAFNGSIGGRIFVDVRGADSQIDFRGDLTGLELAADKQPLDAHMAIRLKPWRRTLEGRVDVARTSPDQLRLLLDVYDPFGENISANRARQALALGYPKAVRLRFHDGLASLAMELGGLSAAVRIDETRGVPIAPMLEKSLLPMLPTGPPRL